MNQEFDSNIVAMRLEVLTETDIVTLFIIDWAYRNQKNKAILDDWENPISTQDVIAKLVPIFQGKKLGEEELHRNSAQYRLNKVKTFLDKFYDEFHHKTHVIRYRLNSKGKEGLNRRMEKFTSDFRKELDKFYKSLGE